MFILRTEENHGLLEELATGSDRAAAIVGASIVEARLAGAIGRTLKDDKAQFEKMTSNNGALATFSNKITIGYMLDIYGPKALRELEIIRRIRNGFAHNIENIGFSEDAIRDRCLELRSPDENTFEYGEEEGLDNGEPAIAVKEVSQMRRNPRRRYLTTCELLASYFHFWTPELAADLKKQRKEKQ